MMAISYSPSNDELMLKINPLKKKPTREFGRFKLWWNDEGNINGIIIMPFTEELEEFKKNLNTVRLGGIWKGIKITEEDIKKARSELLSKLEDKW
jgi:hypothetical protein